MTAAERPDYGIDAPGVVRNLALSGSACLIVATLSLTHVIISFDDGLGCPKELFERGAVYLVFLREDPDGGYSALNFGQGRFEVRDDLIDYWGRKEVVRLDEAKADIERLMAR